MQIPADIQTSEFANSNRKRCRMSLAVATFVKFVNSTWIDIVGCIELSKAPVLARLLFSILQVTELCVEKLFK